MPAANDIHDLLVIPSNKKLYRFKAIEDGFDPNAQVDFYADEFRSIMSVAATGGDKTPRGPAFSVLPNKPDPSTSQICCYLINSDNVRASNPWTSAAWSSDSEEKNLDLPFEPNSRDDGPLELLVATPDGRVLFVRDDKPPERLDLAQETEMFIQLRNGLVAGSVYSRTQHKVLPIVNVASIFPREGK